jgi:hypothetical protein
MKLWNPIEHTDAENLRWCGLRSMEWLAFPGYLSLACAPLLMLIWPVYTVMLSTFGTNILWCFVRYRFVNKTISSVSCLVVSFAKWPIALGTAIYFWKNGQIGLSIFCAGYPLWGSLPAAFLGGQVGVVQKMLMRELGYFESENVDMQRAA